jgi:uncharacterized membrane protein
MAHCTKCGAVIADNAAFCGTCGAPQAGASAGSGVVTANPGTQSSQMSENVAGLLCYILGWVTGLIFYFIDKRPFVRFHAAQSIVVFGGLHIIHIVLAMMFGMSLVTGGFGAFSGGLAVSWLVSLVGFALWILLMIKAFQHERFRVPIAADLAEKIFGPA